MATNVYFHNFDQSGEQNLIEDLIIESIKVYGHNVYYLPRTNVNRDDLYEESTIQKYSRAMPVEMYIRDVEGFQGEGDFLSKFGLQIRDQITLTVAQRTFQDEVGQLLSNQDDPYNVYWRPKEGDLIYLPLNGKVFKIMFVEHEGIFYQMGTLQTYDLTCELFEYSGEEFDTGVTAIDQIQTDYSTVLEAGSLLTESGNYLQTAEGYNLVTEDSVDEEEIDPIGFDNDFFQTQGESILDFSDSDPFSESGRF